MPQIIVLSHKNIKGLNRDINRNASLIVDIEDAKINIVKNRYGESLQDINEETLCGILLKHICAKANCEKVA